MDCIFLKREWDRDAETIRETFRKFLQYRIPVWLISFPEGTRLKPEKLAKARDFAAKVGRQIPERVLIPRTRGFVASVTGLQSHITAVYDIKIAYDEPSLSMWALLTKFGGHFHLLVKRYPIEALPTDEERLSEYLLERFEEKDRLLGGFAREKRFLVAKPLH